MTTIAYTLKGITADELSFKVNRVKAPSTRFEIKPTFSRQIRQANENPNVFIVALDCKIESTPDSPKPFDLVARYIAIFETDGLNTDEEKKALAIRGTEILLPYLRGAISNVTATAMINPLTLPVIPGDMLFPEDRPAQPENGNRQYTLTFDENLLN